MRSGRRHHGAAAKVAVEPGSGKFVEVTLAAIAVVIITYYFSLTSKYLSSATGLLAYPTLVLVGLLVLFAATTLLGARRRFTNLYHIARRYWPVLASAGLLGVLGLAWSLMPGAYPDLYSTLLYPFNFVVLVGGALLPLSRLFRRSWRYVFLLPYLILVASVLYGAVEPETFGHAGGRSAALGMNPNNASFGIVLLSAALLRPYRIDPYNVALLCLSGVAIFVTFSRAGLICLGMLLFFYLWTVRLSFTPRNLALIGIAVGLGLVGILYGAKPLLEGAELSDSRLAMFSLERDPLSGSSASKRISLIVETVDKIKEAPILGHGTAATRWDPVGPHNMYLTLWAELGIAGFLLYVVFLAAGYRLFAQRQFFTGQAVVLVTALYSVFSHMMLTRPEIFVLYGMLMSVSWYESRRTRRAAALPEGARRRKQEGQSQGRRSGRSSGSSRAGRRPRTGETGAPGVTQGTT